MHPIYNIMLTEIVRMIMLFSCSALPLYNAHTSMGLLMHYCNVMQGGAICRIIASHLLSLGFDPEFGTLSVWSFACSHCGYVASLMVPPFPPKKKKKGCRLVTLQCSRVWKSVQRCVEVSVFPGRNSGSTATWLGTCEDRGSSNWENVLKH